MLNWIVIWVGVFLFGLGGPLQNDTQESVPISNDVLESAKLHVWWGDALLQGLHIGFFIAIGALVVYWIILNRTTLGYGVKAVGFNPEAARYGGISVARNYFLAMAISGAFAGLAGAIDILGWQFRLSTGDIQTSQIGFVGIAVALLGRNTAIGTRPRGAALRRAPHRHLDAEPRPRDLPARARVQPDAPDPGARRPLRRAGHDHPLAPRAAARSGGSRHDERRAAAATGRRSPLRTLAWVGIGARASLAAFVALPPISARSWVPSLVLGLLALAARHLRHHARREALRLVRGRGRGAARLRPRVPRDALGDRQARDGRRLVGALRLDAALRDAAHLRRARRHVLGALRRRRTSASRG